MSTTLLTITVRSERDVVTVRQRVREVAAALGLESQDQTRLATASSEIARNAVVYGGGGTAELLVDGVRAPQMLVVRVSDRGPGIADVDAVLAGRAGSSTGFGLGMRSARRLVDRFEVSSTAGSGTTVAMGKLFPRRSTAITAAELAALAGRLAGSGSPVSMEEELRRQNQELLVALELLRQRQEDLSFLNAELADTNRGVVALYAELDEKADTLRRADALKSRFLSHMSHEFRTPLNSMLALTRLLQDDPDHPLSPEQRRQVSYIRQAAEDLTELVNDLLDLASVESGKVAVRATEFDLRNVFAALRGMLRPLLVNEAVALVFEEPVGVPLLVTDEAKVSQILRNFLSNALKFTERGEVRVSARLTPDGTAVACSVADTGLGIAPEDQQRIFDEFMQVENPVQRRVRGTGLGLSLVRQLVTLLGGRVSVESTPGVGSTFTATIPLVYQGTSAVVPSAEPLAAREVDGPAADRVLLIDDDEISRYLVCARLAAFSIAVDQAANGAEGIKQARSMPPRAIVLDLVMPGLTGFEVLERLKADPVTEAIPVVVLTSKLLTDDERHVLSKRAVAIVSKDTLARDVAEDPLLDALASAGLSWSGSGG